MFLNKIVQPSLLKKILTPTNLRHYTVIVERCEPTPLLKNGMDPRRYPLKSKHFRYKFVECQHTQKWGNVDLILTDYVEGKIIQICVDLSCNLFLVIMFFTCLGVGHKGEIISAPRHLAYYSLLPSRLAVYPTEEYLEMYKEDRVAAALKPKVSPYALKTQEELNKMVLNIQMNMDSDWTLNRDHIRLALRYNVSFIPIK